MEQDGRQHHILPKNLPPFCVFKNELQPCERNIDLGLIKTYFSEFGSRFLFIAILYHSLVCCIDSFSLWAHVMPFCNDVGPVLDRIRRKLKHSCIILNFRSSSELLRPDVKFVKCFTPARFSIFYIVPEKTAYIATFLAIYPSQCHNWPLTLEILTRIFPKPQNL